MQYKTILWIFGCATLVTATAHGQTKFTWPTRPVDVSRYKTVEECLAGAYRIRDSIVRPLLSRRDTAPPSASDVMTPVPVPAQQFAQHCGAQFDTSTSPLTEVWDQGIMLSLLAGDDDKAAAIVRRRLAGVPSDSLITLTLVLDSAINAYLAAPPVRLRTVDSLVKQIPPLIPAFIPHVETLIGLARRIIGLMTLAQQAGDSVVARSLAQRILAEWDRIPTDNAMMSQLQMLASGYIMRAQRYLSYTAMLDSLRKGTTAYLSLVNQHAQRAHLLNRGRIGERASPISADFWFLPPSNTSNISTQSSPSQHTAPTSSLVRPTLGRVSLIVFFHHGCDKRIGTPTPPNTRSTWCGPQYAALRRLVGRYPQLEVTIVSQTFGFFGWMPPVAPAEEADSLRAWWLGFHKLPATLAVTTTEWWRLEAPDNRRINKTSPNVEAYEFGQKQLDGLPYIWPGTAFLIDQDGVIIHHGRVGSIYPSDRLNELEFDDLIRTLMERPHTSTNDPAPGKG